MTNEWGVPAKRRQVAIAGKVFDARTNAPLAGVTVTITAMPPAFQQWLSLRMAAAGSAWSTMIERPDRTVTAAGGDFAFVDLPDGLYSLTFTAPPRVGRYGQVQQDFKVERDAQGHITLSVRQVPMPPTGIAGRITGAAPGGQGTASPLAMARVRVLGSDESAYGDADGRFYIPGVQPGTRSLEISASGYQTTTTTVGVSEGSVTDTGSITLLPVAP